MVFRAGIPRWWPTARSTRVAGLIRSIDYSATAALDRALRSAPDEHGKIAKALDDWRERAADAVLSAYHERLSDPRLWPQDRDKADRLLDFFLLEKVFYEIEYELSYRPDWVRVPLPGIGRAHLPSAARDDLRAGLTIELYVRRG